MQALCDKGASPTIQDNEGNTPLHFLLRGRIVYKNCERLLNTAYLMKNHQGETPLHQWAKIPQPLTNYIVNTIELPSFPSPECAEEAFLAQDHAGNNVLHIAAEHGNAMFIYKVDMYEKAIGERCHQVRNHNHQTPDDIENSEHLTDLGLTSLATLQNVKDTYKKLALQCHPDKHPGNAKAEAQFKKISVAASYLINGPDNC